MGFSLIEKAKLELFRQYKHAQAYHHKLNYLFWECTLRCNLQCAHCGSDCIKDAQVSDMPSADFLKVIDSITPFINPNTTTIAITGGEPLMRKDLEEVGFQLHQRGFPWGIVTNGVLLSQSRYESLLKAGLRSMSVSFDGLKEAHDWMRQKEGAFECAVNSIKMATATPGLMFDVISCIYPKNIDHLEEMKAFLIALGVKKWRVFTVFSKGRAAASDTMNLTPSQITQLLQFIEKTRKEGLIEVSNNCEGFIGKYEFTNRKNPFVCGAGINVSSILIDGSISACPSLRGDYIQGNIYKDTFIDVWERHYQKMRDRKWTKTGACATCNEYRYCEGGPMHLRDEKDGTLLHCHNHMMQSQ